MNTFSEVVQTTLDSVRAQISQGNISTGVITRHVCKHTGTNDRVIVDPVVERVGDELYREQLYARLNANA